MAMSTDRGKDQLQAGEVIACRYRVEAHCRKHPLGELYRCHDEFGNRVVLLQRLRREFAAEGVRDRLFETRQSASMESTVIADILDYGDDLDGRPFVVTAWTDHASLDAVERPLAFLEAVTIVERVAAALAPVHARQLVHGGIEPASILVDDARELTGLHGFGLAPALQAGVERSRALPLLASPTYAAPELIRGVPIGPAADVYALGVLLWELIFGAPPFRGPTLKVLDAHLERPLPDIELPFDAPASFEWILRRMLAKSPADRFADAGVVAEQLRGYLDAPAVPSIVIDEPEDEEDETVVFASMRSGVDKPVDRSVAVGLSVESTESMPRARRRWLPRVAAALIAAASLTLLTSLALRDRSDDVAAERIDVEDDVQQAIATRTEPLAVEAIPRTPAAKPEPTIVRAPAKPTQPAAPSGPLPSKLDKRSFKANKDRLYELVESRCVENRVRRSFDVAVRVDAEGKVASATVLGKMGSSALGRCVERQAKRLEFPHSREGGSHRYSVRLR
jgi:serine/threonine-protein kinase